jgi:hypothetical protein
MVSTRVANVSRSPCWAAPSTASIFPGDGFGRDTFERRLFEGLDFGPVLGCGVEERFGGDEVGAFVDTVRFGGVAEEESLHVHVCQFSWVAGLSRAFSLPSRLAASISS